MIKWQSITVSSLDDVETLLVVERDADVVFVVVCSYDSRLF